MKGVFGLRSHVELMQKLEWEFEQLIAKPNNAYHAYNFFVTAWHIVSGSTQTSNIPDPIATSGTYPDIFFYITDELNRIDGSIDQIQSHVDTRA